MVESLDRSYLLCCCDHEGDDAGDCECNDGNDDEVTPAPSVLGDRGGRGSRVEDPFELASMSRQAPNMLRVRPLWRAMRPPVSAAPCRRPSVLDLATGIALIPREAAADSREREDAFHSGRSRCGGVRGRMHDKMEGGSSLNIRLCQWTLQNGHGDRGGSCSRGGCGCAGV